MADGEPSTSDLPVVLRQIVESACDWPPPATARSASSPAKAVSSSSSTSASTARSPADRRSPHGQGLLGALINDPRPIRLEHMLRRPALGRLSRRPPADGLLPRGPDPGAGRGFGNLYLTDSRQRRFTAEDEELVSRFAATAGIAIDNARLFDESRAQRWLGRRPRSPASCSPSRRGSAGVARPVASRSPTPTWSPLVCPYRTGGLLGRGGARARAAELVGRDYPARGYARRPGARRPVVPLVVAEPPGPWACRRTCARW